MTDAKRVIDISFTKIIGCQVKINTHTNMMVILSLSESSLIKERGRGEIQAQVIDYPGVNLQNRKRHIMLSRRCSKKFYLLNSL